MPANHLIAGMARSYDFLIISGYSFSLELNKCAES
jgi:hypothetical protein